MVGHFLKKSNIPTGKHYDGGWGAVDNKERTEMGSGSAARFFYCAKASKADRGENHHPTVKPTDLMRYLCRLVTPPNGIVLDPFNGSGSTGCAAVLEGFQYIGIEREAEYIAISEKRIQARSKQVQEQPKQLALL
jgi:DNA modification methylase